MKVLLVDDEPLELLQLEYLISPHFPNWELYKAEDASIALDLAKRNNFFLAFLDIQMPGEDGLTLASKLKNLYELDIVMVTAFQSFEYAQTAIRIGVEDFITKPIIEKDFVTLLDKFKSSKTNCSTIQDVIHIIREKYHQELTLNQLAEQVFLNPSYLSRKFHEETGMKFSEYLNVYRLEMAAKLLKENNNYNMAIIAEKCGFNSQHYFSTMFRRKYGITPRNYAKNIS